MDIMIDLETLSTRPDAAIIQIGAVLFEPVSGGKILNDKGFNSYTLIQDGAGSIDNSTLAWWLQEKSAAKMGAELEHKAVSLGEALKAFVEWPMNTKGIYWNDITGIWAKPADFDFPILRMAFNRFGLDAPWNRHATRCAKTLFHAVGKTPDIDWTGFIYHDALDDAIGQAMQVQKAMGLLNKKN